MAPLAPEIFLPSKPLRDLRAKKTSFVCNSGRPCSNERGNALRLQFWARLRRGARKRAPFRLPPPSRSTKEASGAKNGAGEAVRTRSV